MKDWIQTRHHEILMDLGLKPPLSELPVRKPGESRQGVEIHHYVPKASDATPAQWTGMTPRQIEREITQKLADANQNSQDTRFGPVEVEVIRRKTDGLRIIAYRPTLATTHSPFTPKEPPEKWGQNDAHQALVNRGLQFQSAFTEGRFGVYEYHLDTQAHPDRDHAEIREVLRKALATALPEGMRGAITTQWHPLRAQGEQAYRHALIVQVRLRITPKKPSSPKT